MKLDELPPEQQESATYCHGCGEVVNKILLAACEECGMPVCNTIRCSRRCLCGMLKDGLIDLDEYQLEAFKYLTDRLAAEAKLSPSGPEASVLEDLKHQMEEFAAEAKLSPSGPAPSQEDETTDIVGQLSGSLRGTHVGVTLRFRATLGN